MPDTHQSGGACGEASMKSPVTGLVSRFFHSAVMVLLAFLLLPANLSASESKLSPEQRQAVIRAFLAERPFVHRTFPRGKTGLKVEGDKITPSEEETRQIVAQAGAAAKPGERAAITAVHFVHQGIVFEINGGPMKRKKWTDRISVGVNGVDPSRSSATPANESVYTNSNGSSIFLSVKEDAAGLTVDQIKTMLEPVLDFKATSVAEAYQKSLPPVLAAAVKHHKALVGMDKEMVTYAMGRPPRRIREARDGQDYEEWIYGTPPQDVEFIRFLGDKAVSIEDMKVNGEKIVRTQDEVGDLSDSLNADAGKPKRPGAAAADEDRRSAPTLLRPDEKPASTGLNSNTTMPLPQDDPNPPSTPGPR